MQTRFLVPIVIVALLLAVLGIGLTLDPSKVPSPLIGKPAPDFVLPKLYQPDQLIASADLKGQVTLVNVWASWCAACRDEHAQVSRLAKEFGLKVVGLNYKDKPEDARGWLAKFGNPYAVIAVDEAGNAGIDWGVYGVPETFILDTQGVIRYKHIGPITAEDVSTTILPLVETLEGAS